MTIRATKFTPEVLLSAPRRSPGIPNSNATKILYSVSTYSFDTHSKKSEIRILDVRSQQTTLVTDDGTASDPNWLDDEHVLLLSSGKHGTTTVKIGRADDFANSHYTAGHIGGPVGNAKVLRLDSDTFAIAVSAETTPDGEIYNPEKASKPFTSGRLYKGMFVRHWDRYVTPQRSSIWLGTLTKKDTIYQLSPLRNALNGTGLESPIPPFGGTDHFDIGPTGLIFTAKDPDLDPALHTKTNIYLITSKFSWSTILQSIPKPRKVELKGFEGASTSPVFSPDGKQAAFLSMRTDGYEADKNQIFILPDVFSSSTILHAFATPDGKGSWDRSPSAIIWGNSEELPLFFLAEDHGRGCLFASKFTGNPEVLETPDMVARGGAISDVRPIPHGYLFLSSTSLIDNSSYSLLNVKDNKMTALSSSTKEGYTFGLSNRQVSELHWEGAAEGTEVHAWMVKPSNFHPDKKYPLAYLIHGGPQGAWQDSWSTRWNPAVFAEQGYVVICPNPTGSTGYGQAFTDAIRGEWGGLPYQDLVKGFEWIEKNLDYVDTDRAVGLGASYGGYMMNWFQGHPLGRKFKALVTHDGFFSMTGQLASEELYFPFHDLKSKLWEDRAAWEQWDPSRFVENWATPHLIIHSELDYRLTIAEGLAAFHTLQSRGVESQFLTFADENHWVLKPENSLLWHEVVLDWINGHVGLPLYSETRKREKDQSPAPQAPGQMSLPIREK